MKLVPLGTNGFFPSFGRQTMSFLLLTESQALLLDAGSGVSRLVEPELKKLIAPYEDLNIVFSHYHLDHVIGLSYLSAVWPSGKVRLFGPASPLVASDPATALRKLFGPPLFPISLDKLYFEIHPVRDTEFTIGDLPLVCWRQPHPGGSVGIRIGDDMAYMTDTSAEAANLQFASGVKLLLHELWLTDAEAEGQKLTGHSNLSAVADFAQAAGPGRLMVVHHHPKRDKPEVRKMAAEVAKRTGIPTTPGEEGTPIEI